MASSTASSAQRNMPHRSRKAALKRREIGDDSEGDDLSPQTSSSSVKKRTGQACTRCRQRKIKCDENITGCRACKDAGEVCEVRDRNTGQVAVRGEYEDLQADKRRLEEEVRELRERVKHFGPIDLALDVRAPFQDGPPPRLAALDPTNLGEAYLGSPGISNLSVIRGSTMSIYGHDFELTTYFPSIEASAVFELSDREYDEHVQKVVRVSIPIRPLRKDAENYAHVFFTGIAFFTPIVHRPAFYDLLKLLYCRKPDPDLTMSQNVLFHMVCAIAQFQMAKRTGIHRDALEAKERLLFCLTFVNDLLRSPMVEAMQALVLICMAMRQLQRPGPACRFCELVLGRAINLGFHRKAEAFAPGVVAPNTVEMRQRLFWTLMVFHVNISGNLGRPMRLRSGDFDIEIPIATPDLVAGLSPSASDCSWRFAPLGFMLTAIELEAYSTFRTVREDNPDNPRFDKRHTKMGELDAQLTTLERKIPEEASLGGDPLSIVATSYLKLGIYATRLKLLHPANLPSHFSLDRRRELTVASRQILGVATVLTTYQSLDTTVYYNMDFIHAIFVDLWVAAQDAQDNLPVNMDELNKAMNRWYWVLSELGKMLGTGYALCERVKSINENVLGRIQNTLNQHLQQGQLSEPIDHGMTSPQHSFSSLPMGMHENDTPEYASSQSAYLLTGESSENAEFGVQYAQQEGYAVLLSPNSHDGVIVQAHDQAVPVARNGFGRAQDVLSPTAQDGYYHTHPPSVDTLQYHDQYQQWSNELELQGEPATLAGYDQDLGEVVMVGQNPYASAMVWTDMLDHGNASSSQPPIGF